MCDPASLLAAGSFAIGAAQSVTTYAAGAQEANNQRAYQAQATANAQAARIDTVNQLVARQGQETDKTAQALFDNKVRADQARARVDVSAGENGVLGNSIEVVARDYFAQQDRIDTATLRNNSMVQQQLEAEKTGADAQYRQRTTFQSIKEPSLIGLGLGIGGAAISAGSVWDRAQNGQTRSSTR
jgi:hypothetical protein